MAGSVTTLSPSVGPSALVVDKNSQREASKASFSQIDKVEYKVGQRNFNLPVRVSGGSDWLQGSEP
jgi:hypothetical protein